MQSAPNVSKTFKIATLGCRTNQYESQAFADQLRALGYREAENGETAQISIVNTCTVTKSADNHSRRQIRQLARQQPGSRIVVTGCLAERDPEQLQKLNLDLEIIPNAKKQDLIAEILPDEDAPEFSIKNFEARTRAFVKVQDGCNSFCSYCIIPYVRGRSRSRAIDDILSEIKTLVCNGYREVVLTGINIGDYIDKSSALDLADLVGVADQIPGLDRLRISSIDPDEVDEKLLSAVIKGKTTCPSMHIVLQSGSNIILKRMNRKYTRQIFLDTCMRLCQANPDFAFTTDVIVGFPGETEADFQETIDVVRQVGFTKVHVFPFSSRPGTRAHRFENQISAKVIKERTVRLMHATEQIAYLKRQAYVGRIVEVLTEDRGKEGELAFGHTGNFMPVFIEQAHLPANCLVRVSILANSPKGLLGMISDQPQQLIDNAQD